jgi:hypothetical protein
LAIFVPAFAYEKQMIQPSEMFKKFCTEYFLSPSEYQVLDKNNISNTYFCDNIDNFNSTNIDLIWDYSKRNVSMFTKRIVTDEKPDTRSPYINKNIKDWIYILETSGKYTPDFELQQYISGNYLYNMNTGVISSYTGPTTWIDGCSLRGIWSYEMTDVSTRATIAPNKYSITFTASFKLRTTCSVPIGNISVPGFSETFGTYTNSITGYPE